MKLAVAVRVDWAYEWSILDRMYHAVLERANAAEGFQTLPMDRAAARRAGCRRPSDRGGGRRASALRAQARVGHNLQARAVGSGEDADCWSGNGGLNASDRAAAARG